MATNFYFNNFAAKNEQALYEDLVNETVQTWGIDAYYLPRSSESEFDFALGDDPTKEYYENYPVEVYISDVDEFEGGDFFSKFGIEVRKQTRLMITQRSFSRHVPSRYKRPREGDLLWLKNFRALFEIKFTNEERLFYQFGTEHLYAYELVCEKFRYNDETLDVGIEDFADDVVRKHITAYTHHLAINACGINRSFVRGEQVYQGDDPDTATAVAEVVSFDKNNLTVDLANIKGHFIVGLPMRGVVSRGIYDVIDKELLDDTSTEFDQNMTIQNEADSFLNFDEANPFGEP